MTDPNAPPPPPTGILVIDKPLGPTSMDVCRRVRGKLRAAGAPKRIKVGHGGTLDPLATGLLVVLVGKATPLCDRIMAGEKRYLTHIDLAHTSTTDDAEGERTEVTPGTVPTRDTLDASIAQHTGTIQQTPPAYSAVKVGGQRAYALARSGETPVIQPRPVVIHDITVVSYEYPQLVLDIRCGKGTYIRSLARDIGAAMDCGGMLTALRRTGLGRFTIDDATALDDLPATLTQQDLRPVGDWTD